MAKREMKYKSEFLSFGFTDLKERSGLVRPQCVQCMKVLSNESLKDSKLKRHLITAHADFVDKPLHFWKEKEANLKRMRLDSPTSSATVSLEKTIKASFEVAWKIVRAKKPHNVGEELVKPAAIAMVKTVCGVDMANKLEMVPLSNNSIKRRIDALSMDILEQVVCGIKRAKKFSIQTDESVDVTSNAQLMVFIRHKTDKDFAEEFLFCAPLLTTTTGLDIFEMVDKFFKHHNILWTDCMGVCTDGAPAMVGKRVGFCTLVKEVSPDVIIIHCFVHRENLATNNIQPDLNAVLNDIIYIVNFIKSNALNTHIFRVMCEDFQSEYLNPLYHSEVRWLSRGKVLARVISLRMEIEIFLTEKKHPMADKFNDHAWLAKLTFLADIFEHMNVLNTDMQGRNRTMVDIREKIISFKSKLALKLLEEKIASFPLLNQFLEDSNNISLHNLVDIFKEYLERLEIEMNRYIPENVELRKHSWVQNPFDVNVEQFGDDIPRFQEELLDLKENQILRKKFDKVSLTQFWAQLMNKPVITREAEKALLPFPTTYLCEAGFSALVVLKTKYRNRLNVEHDLRCALSINLQPDINKLVEKVQHQGSH